MAYSSTACAETRTSGCLDWHSERTLHVRFATQRVLAEANTFADPATTAEMLAVLEAAQKIGLYSRQVGLPGREPELMLTVSSPGRLSYLAGEPLEAGALALIQERPERMASISFDPIGLRGSRSPGLLKELRRVLPEALEEAGLRPGDLVMGSPEGLGRGDYRRALTFMQQGMGPADVLNQQRARVAPGGALQPAMIYSVHEGLADRLGWL